MFCFETDGNGAWCTEAGWLLTPPFAACQEIHIDVASGWWSPRPLARARMPHIIWRRRPGQRVSTRYLPGEFYMASTVPGRVEAAARPGWASLCSQAGVIESAGLLHGGAGNNSCEWVTALTIQLCSGHAWRWNNWAGCPRTVPLGAVRRQPDPPDLAELLAASQLRESKDSSSYW